MKPMAQEAYDLMAEEYASLIDTKPHNAYYERPATLSLLPDVKGKRVLDAGCGPGVYSEWLVNRGAEVVAIDANEKMVNFARERLGSKAQVIVANLEQPLDFLENASFDMIISALVMDYIEDWGSVFREFYRILGKNGGLVFSFEHPFSKYDTHRESGSYFEVEKVEIEWRGFGKAVRMPSYRRPLGEVINPLLQAGFFIDKVLEPKPTEVFKEKAPEDYKLLTRYPGFLCIRAIKQDR